MRLLFLLALTTLAIPASAGLVDLDRSTAESGPGRILVTPTGMPLSLAEAGIVVNVVVYAEGYPDPTPGMGAHEVDLRPLAGEPQGGCGVNRTIIHADGNSDANGAMTISGVGAGGGFAPSMQVYMRGVPLNGPPLPIVMVSPDYNGDLRVDLEDAATFVADWSNPVHQTRSDFDGNGVLDLQDVGVMAANVGTSCP